MDARAPLALAGVAFFVCACGYDYQDRNAALDRLPAIEDDTGCHAGEALEGARNVSLREIAASPASFATSKVRVRGTLKSAASEERLAEGGVDIRLDVADLPPFLIERCPGGVVVVDGTVAKKGEAPVLHAVAMTRVRP